MATSNEKTRRTIDGALSRHTSVLVGKMCWGMVCSKYFNLSMSFGPPRLKIRDPTVSTSALSEVRRQFARRGVRVQGRWWLWIFLARWRLSLPNEGVEVTWKTPRRKMMDALNGLEGQILTSMRVTPKTGATVFNFDMGATLTAWRLTRTSDGEIWKLYKPGERYVGVWGDGTYRAGPTSE